tara:strand:+ start:1942 stop:2409 length:468 start_codon:yes stop_codon:yes gene_type:complete
MSFDSKVSLKTRLKEDVKTSLRAGDKFRLGVLRMALAAIQRQEVDSRKDSDDIGVQRILEKMVKQRHEAVEQFLKGSRQDLAEKEKLEITVLKNYLPEPLTEKEMANLVERVLASFEANSPADMGRVMAEIKRLSDGRADLGKISLIVRTRLSKN